MAEENNMAHVYYSGKFRQRKTKLCHKVKVEAVLMFEANANCVLTIKSSTREINWLSRR